MKDLIQTLVARTLGTEPVMQPSVGSLYQPNDSAGWDRSQLQEIVEEVVVRPGITLAAGSTMSRLSSSNNASRAAPRTASPVLRSDSITIGTKDRPASTTESPPTGVPGDEAAETRASMSRSSPHPVPRAPALRFGMETPPSAPMGGAIDAIDAAVGSERGVPAPFVQRSTPATRATTDKRLTGEPGTASHPASAGMPASRAVRRAPETTVAQGRFEPEPGELGRRQPSDRPVPVAPGAEPEQQVIQVTIGRVEVRAIAPPQAAAPPARRRPFPSLEEYLERTSEARA